MAKTEEPFQFIAELTIQDVISNAEANDLKCSKKKAAEFLNHNSEAIQEAVQEAANDFVNNELMEFLEG